jgi:hypothetical protein
MSALACMFFFGGWYRSLFALPCTNQAPMVGFNAGYSV